MNLTFEEFRKLVLCDLRQAPEALLDDEWYSNCPCGHDVRGHGTVNPGCETTGCKCIFTWVEAGLAALKLPIDYQFTAEKAMPHA